MNCHASCQEYLAEVAANQALAAKIRKEKNINSQLNDIREEKFRKLKDSHNRRWR